ncbi:hypothetical protein P8625_12360 [Tenacibaculum tangerinum]|uniref:Uncharacterized protein n=1 Tax=Tenacibaculum tangerinum TaxID=3038772 RepID=A0ABY8L065_9FLAO|nr:hypothetical protein [Tenacibaculum tangerinum]WGH74861.1 hypothetical protein P8625_12360 [Tenacibaculum tangerinum]
MTNIIKKDVFIFFEFLKWIPPKKLIQFSLENTLFLFIPNKLYICADLLRQIMIVFYLETKKITATKPVKKLQEATICNAICTNNCGKPKSKCCNKYLKKGVNCKRCPLTFNLKAVS